MKNKLLNKIQSNSTCHSCESRNLLCFEELDSRLHENDRTFTCHSCESRNPLYFAKLDSHFRGNDEFDRVRNKYFYC